MSIQVSITSEFWKRYRNLVRTEMIPFQWNVLHDQAGIAIEKERIGDDGIPSEKSHAIENFKIAAGSCLSGTRCVGRISTVPGFLPPEPYAAFTAGDCGRILPKSACILPEG